MFEFYAVNYELGIWSFRKHCYEYYSIIRARIVSRKVGDLWRPLISTGGLWGDQVREFYLCFQKEIKNKCEWAIAIQHICLCAYCQSPLCHFVMKHAL